MLSGVLNVCFFRLGTYLAVLGVDLVGCLSMCVLGGLLWYFGLCLIVTLVLVFTLVWWYLWIFGVAGY